MTRKFDPNNLVHLPALDALAAKTVGSAVIVHRAGHRSAVGLREPVARRGEQAGDLDAGEPVTLQHRERVMTKQLFEGDEIRLAHRERPKAVEG